MLQNTIPTSVFNETTNTLILKMKETPVEEIDNLTRPHLANLTHPSFPSLLPPLPPPPLYLHQSKPILPLYLRTSLAALKNLYLHDQPLRRRRRTRQELKLLVRHRSKLL
jgi:hypothetical protein